MRRACVALTLLSASLATLDTAQARIRLNDAQIMAGVLVVGGWTQKRGETVTLDGKYTVKSDRKRRFVFRIDYFPPSCAVALTAGADTRTAVIANCGTVGLAGPKGDKGDKGDKGERGEAGPQGLAGPVGPQGPAGPQGVAGPVGPIGPQGEIGPRGPEGMRGERGEPGLVGAKGEPGLTGAGVALRRISRDCKENEVCTLACDEGETALNAVCPGGTAMLTDPRTVTCSNRPAASVMAFCAK